MNFQNLLNLPSVPLPGRDNLPGSTGIYFAITSSECLYIGQSRNFRKRWLQHHRLDEVSERDDVRIAWMNVTEPCILDDLEIALIKHFKPRLNRQYSQHEQISKPIAHSTAVEPKVPITPVEELEERLFQILEGANRPRERDEDYHPMVYQMAKLRGTSAIEYLANLRLTILGEMS